MDYFKGLLKREKDTQKWEELANNDYEVEQQILEDYNDQESELEQDMGELEVSEDNSIEQGEIIQESELEQDMGELEDSGGEQEVLEEQTQKQGVKEQYSTNRIKNNFKKIIKVQRISDFLFLLMETIIFAVLIAYHQWFSIVSFLPLIPLTIWLTLTDWFLISKTMTKGNFMLQLLKNNSIRKYSIIMSYMGLLIPSLVAIWFNEKNIIFFFEEWQVKFGNMILFAVLCLVVFGYQHIDYVVIMIMTNKEINKHNLEMTDYQWDKLKKINKSLFFLTLLYIAIYLVVVVVLIAKLIKKKK